MFLAGTKHVFMRRISGLHIVQDTQAFTPGVIGGRCCTILYHLVNNHKPATRPPPEPTRHDCRIRVACRRCLSSRILPRERAFDPQRHAPHSHTHFGILGGGGGGGEWVEYGTPPCAMERRGCRGTARTTRPTIATDATITTTCSWTTSQLWSDASTAARALALASRYPYRAKRAAQVATLSKVRRRQLSCRHWLCPRRPGP